MANSQAILFFVFALDGLIIGIFFDFFRVLRRSFSTGNILTALEDILFWILVGITLLYSIFVYNNGVIRGYIFLAVFCGVSLYMLTLSKMFININVKIIVFLKKFIKVIIKFIIIPAKVILKILKKVIFGPITFVFVNLKKIYKEFIKKIKSITIKQKNTNIKKDFK